jgi:hypothetical protein
MRTPRHACTILARSSAVACLLSVAACGNPGDMGRAIEKSGQQRANLASCKQGRIDDLMPLAVGAYIKGATPKPQRFLVAVGTDSSVGDGGLRALQDRGPTYLFPGDAGMQANVRAQLHEKGDYTTRLVVRRGGAVDGPRATVDLAGHYVGGEEDGTHAGPRTFAFSCDSTGWHLAAGGARST